MKQETITKAVEVLNCIIKDYQERATHLSELKADARSTNGVYSSSNYESSIKEYETILAKLATIKRNIENNPTSVQICAYSLKTTKAMYEVLVYCLNNDSPFVICTPIDEQDD